MCKSIASEFMLSAFQMLLDDMRQTASEQLGVLDRHDVHLALKLSMSRLTVAADMHAAMIGSTWNNSSFPSAMFTSLAQHVIACHPCTVMF